MKRPGYREAIEWLAENDDNEWIRDPLDDESLYPSVSAIMVADLFGISNEKLEEDLRRCLVRRRRAS